MFKKILNKKLLKNQKGLTLIELLAVIVILAIIAAIAIPAIGNIINNSRDKAHLSDAAGLLSGAKIAIADGSCGQPVSNVITCKGDKLTDVYDGKGKLDPNDTVEYNVSTKVYKITFKGLGEIKNIAKFTVGTTFTPPSTIISDEDLVKAMNQ
ncbi:prepilin-type N-terminal cleavage/methylation domain-containing protein [Lysinibacillus sp. NPDC096212]|uniref:prepilin-type N-terminal cleavage/methylation domain-containing protein n=1 Tax=Lysinibacillus sp. NPDC096212 TaxID=3364135 RepID=UPI0037F74F57